MRAPRLTQVRDYDSNACAVTFHLSVHFSHKLQLVWRVGTRWIAEWPPVAIRVR